VMEEPTNENRGTRIVKLSNKQDRSTAGIYIDDLSSFRAAFEKQKPGDLNSFGEYVHFEEADRNTVNKTSMEALRILKINGYHVGKDENVWVNSNSSGMNVAKGLSYNDEGIVEINRIPVINMRAISK